MANPKDFSARQIRVAQLIASGGITGTNAGLVVYSASLGTDLRGGFPAGLLTGVGNDVFFFVSGSKRSKISRGHSGNGDKGVTLFGGDVVFSGTMYADRMVVEVDMSQTGSLLISGSLIVSKSADIGQGLVVNKSFGQLGEDNFAVRGRDRRKDLIVTKVENNQVFVLTGSTENSARSGGSSPHEAAYTDLAFFVSGTAGSRSSSTKGVSVFGGDTVISGTLFVSGAQGAGKTYSGGSISGSIHRTRDGLSYLHADGTIVITSASNGQIKVHSPPYVAGDGLDLTGTTFSVDLKAGGGLEIDSTELDVNDSKVAMLTGSDFSGPVKFSGPIYISGSVSDFETTGSIRIKGATSQLFVQDTISGSIHRTAAGLSYIKAGTNIAVTSGTNGQITIQTAGVPDGSGGANRVAYWSDSNTLTSKI